MKKIKIVTLAVLLFTSLNINASGPVWFNGFSDATEWTSGGPGSNPPEYGWSIQSTISSWYSGFQSNMNTPGKFAHFRNDGLIQTPGPFTFTYNGTIDLTGVPVPHIEFDQYGARSYNLQSVQISLDGINWLEVFNNNDIIPINDGGSIYPRPMFRRVNIDPFLTGDISEVRVRLFCYGNSIDYGWYVDNIRIVAGEENDLKLDKRFAYTVGNLGYMNTKIPASQVPVNNSLKMEFRGDITNNGTETQSAYLRATSGNYTGNSLVKIVNSLQKDSLFILGNQAFTIPTTPGNYNFTLTVLSDNTLTNTTDDQLTFPFEVTPVSNGVMANDFYNGQPNSITGLFKGWENNSEEQSIGTLFEIFNTTTKTTSIGSVDIGIGIDEEDWIYIGNTVYAQIWRLVNDEFILAGVTNEHVLTSSDFGKIVRVYFDDCIDLIAGEKIVVMASFVGYNPVPIAFAGESLTGTTIGRYYGSFVSLPPSTENGPYVRVPVVRPVFSCYKELSINDQNLNPTKIHIYPNPTFDIINLKFSSDFKNKIDITIIDFLGKITKMSNNFISLENENIISIDVSDINSGIYNISISTNDSNMNYKLIIKND
jgi:hypothetical protein